MIALTREGSVWRLSGELTRESAAAWRESLLSSAQFPEGGELDLAQVTAIDAAGIQVLASLLRTYSCVRLVNANERLRAVCRQLGAAQYLFGDP